MISLRFVLLWLVASFLIACSSSESPDVARSISKVSGVTYRMVDSFNVGNNVVVRALSLSAKEDRLWVGTTVGALEIGLPSSQMLNTYTRENGLANEYVFAAKTAANGDVWLGTNGGGVSRLSSGKWHTYFPMHGLADYWVYSFAEQPDGSIWIGTWAGLSKLNPLSGEFVTYVKELVNEWVYGLAVDSRNQVWVGTEGGVNMYDGNSWHVWTHDDGLGAPNRSGLPFSDNTGLGTRSRHDLSVLMQGRETYNPNYVFSLAVDTKDQIWAGTWGGGVARYNGKVWANFTTEQGLAGDIVYSVATSTEHGYWFGTNRGLSHFDGTKWQTFGVADGLLDQNVYAVAVSQKGDVWAGTRNGVVRFAKN